MITLIEILLFIGSLCFYLASKKAEYIQRFQFENWVKSKQKQSRLIGLTFLVLGFIVAMSSLGLMVGFLIALLSVMLWLSFILLFWPLKAFSYRYMLLLLLLFSLIEFT